MATVTSNRPTLPQGVGKLTPGWRAFLIAAAVVLAFVVVSMIRELSGGMIETGMRGVGTA